ncbi:MAG: Fe-S-containing hydro-lyase [Acidobacteria bacterium]|jgi:fumarate hydratase subunit beta|nr:Fe-S-containing hydro-lyase [Acidobacteriota bacterium]
MAEYKIQTPLTAEVVKKLKIGDKVLLSGVIYGARDAAHKRILDGLAKGEKVPFDVEGSVIYYVGPSPARPGKVIGAAGPTTAYRMDAYAPKMMELGMRGMIAKGKRNDAVKDAMKKHFVAYFGATGGAGALINKCIKKAEVVAYEDLGPEALRRMEVSDFPLVVVGDCYGGDLYAEGRKQWEGKS